jgi:hypothetical protein
MDHLANIKELSSIIIRGSFFPRASATLIDLQAEKRKECLTAILKALSHKEVPSRRLLMPIPIPLSEGKRDCLAAIKELIKEENGSNLGAQRVGYSDSKKDCICKSLF